MAPWFLDALGCGVLLTFEVDRRHHPALLGSRPTRQPHAPFKVGKEAHEPQNFYGPYSDNRPGSLCPELASKGGKHKFAALTN